MCFLPKYNVVDSLVIESEVDIFEASCARRSQSLTS